jgi:hypothetical protein
MIPRYLILISAVCALALCPLRTFPADAEDDAMAGRRLNADEAKELEAAVAKQPDDLSARTKLLGYYFSRQYTSPKAKAARQQHILWIIEHRPAAEIAGLPECNFDPVIDGELYSQGKKLWLEQTRNQAANTAVLGNAANFFLLHDRELAENLLKQAQKAEPKNPKWSDRLGHLYALQNNQADAVKALTELERAQAADAGESERFYRLDDLAMQAFAAGDLKKASQYANELLKTAPKFQQDWNYGNAIHKGNIVLGQIALREGRMDEAKEFLLKAGKTPGSPQLDSFGPNMSLAKELVEKGEKEVVLQYFELCRKFWSMGAQQLDAWAKDVKAGNVPEFGANLVY